MGDAEKTTLRLIHSAAMQEFLEKDFASASLRNIVKKAGVTTGAFYGYYASKENLFEALVCKQYEHFIALFRKAQQDFANIPQEEQPKHLGDISGACMEEMLLYAYQHLNVFKLILCHSEGTRFSKLIDEMVEIEIKGTHDYLTVLEKLGRPSPPIDEQLEHVLKRNAGVLYRWLDENYGAVSPIIFARKLVITNLVPCFPAYKNQFCKEVFA